jgi:hypothetical protein
MFNNADFNLLMSEIYLGLMDTNSIKLDLLACYKSMVSDAEEFKGKAEDSVSYLLRLVGSYVDSASKTLSKEVLLQYCSEILNAINTSVGEISVNYHLKSFEYLLCNETTPLSERIDILKASITESAGASLANKIESRANLLDIYLSNPNEHMEDIRALSSELKPLIALRNNG